MLALLLALTFTAIDGDTLTAGEETIRILNIDAPETRDAKCDAERRLGHVAKRRLQEFLDEGGIVITRGDGDRMTGMAAHLPAFRRRAGMSVSA